MVTPPLFFFNDTPPTEIYTLSLHDALPILRALDTHVGTATMHAAAGVPRRLVEHVGKLPARSEEHTSELQSHSDLVCRLLLEKKKRPLPSPRLQYHERSPSRPNVQHRLIQY